MYDNKIDFAVESDDSDTPDAKGDEYTLSFTYSQRLKPTYLKWNTIAVKGQISTDSDDPLRMTSYCWDSQWIFSIFQAGFRFDR